MSLLLPLAAGAAMALGLEPFNWPVVVLPALAVVLWSVSKASRPRDAAVRSWIAGFGYFGASLTWIVNPFLVEPDLYAWMAPFAVVLLPAGLALFWGAGTWIAYRIGRGTTAAAFGLILAELGRAYLFTGFPWGQFAQGYLDTIAMPLVAWIGAQGLSIVFILVAGAAVTISLRQRAARAPVLLILCLPAFPYHPAPEPADPDAPVIRLVQPNAPQAEKWLPEKAEEFLQRQLAASAADDPPALIVWPETAIPYLLNYADYTLSEISERARNVPVILGVNRESGGLYYNSLALLGPGGVPLETYDKRQLVPFGEYIPGGEVMADLGIHGFAARDGAAYAAGQSEELIDVPNIGPVLPLICYEGIFPSMSQRAERPRLLLLITNDGWFGQGAGPKQHFAQARLRSIEQGIPMARVANTGITAMIDAAGSPVAEIPFQTTGFVDAKLPPLGASTIYSGFGRYSALVLTFLSCLATVNTRRNKLR